MRKTILVLMAVSAITFVGCQKEEPVTTTIEGTKITELRSYTEKSPNPINAGNYKLEKSKETLESLTHVSKNRLTHCSAFISHNEKGELLFCHNMDGAGGSVIAVYQRPMHGNMASVQSSVSEG